MNNSKILLITHRRAYECDSLIDELNDAGISFLRYNLDLEDPSRITVDFRRKIAISLECDGKQTDVNSIKLAYFHQTLPEKIYQVGDDQALDSIRRSVVLQTLFSMEGLINSIWINRPSSVHLASNKILQLKKAKEIGIEIPETIVSNDPSKICEFTQDGEFIVKTISSPKYFSDRSESRYFEAETISFDKKWHQEPDALTFVPLIYQEKIKKLKELRIVFIGENVFAAQCDANEAFLDYRVREDIVDIMEPCVIPEWLSCKLKSMLEIYGLQYGSFDMLMDDNGKYIFLELNPTGAFGWIDKVYSGRIYKKFVEYIKGLI